MRLLTKDVAKMVGLKETTIRRYRSRGTFPEPDGHDFGHPWWTQETVVAWMVSRVGGSDAS